MRFFAQSVFRKLSFAVWGWLVLASFANAGTTETKPAVREIRENGESFILISSRWADGIETEEYGLKGETENNWTELIIYQRLALLSSLGADEYILALKRRIEEARCPGKFRIVQENNRAAVFAVEYVGEKSASTELTFGLAVAPEGTQSQQIQIIQYTVSPERISLEKLLRNVQRWKSRFQSEARFTSAVPGMGQ